MEKELKVRSKKAIECQYIPIEERLNSFKEVNLGYTKFEDVIKECQRCYQCFKKSDPEKKPPPCMKYCPTHCNSREIIRNVLENNIEEALRIIYKHYPFPRSVERVCPGYCQLHCTAGKKGDPIQIPTIKRYLVDNNAPIKEYFECDPDTGKKAAIIGSGPLGLSVAYFLRKYGIKVTVFEKLGVIGGMLISEIPAFRLPREVLREELKNIKKLGIEFITNKTIDEKFTIRDLFESGYNIVVIGIGTHKPKQIGLPGEDSNNVLQALKFLKDYNLKKKAPMLEKKTVAVIGGGSTATDAARVAKRLGADASIIYRRKQEQMPAGKTEINESLEEGIRISFLTNPVAFICTEEEFKGAVCQRMELGDEDETGRPKAIPIENSNFKIDSDYIIEAVGQEPNLSEFDTNKLKITKWNTIKVNDKFFTSIPRVLAGGDCVTGSKSVVDAVAHGKIIADHIGELLL